MLHAYVACQGNLTMLCLYVCSVMDSASVRTAHSDILLSCVQLRQKVEGLLANNKPDAIIFLHSLPSHVSERASHSEQTVSASSVLTGFAAHQTLDQRGLQHGKSARHDVLAGKVGECCDDASTHLQNQILPFSRSHNAPLPASDSRHTASHSVEQTTDYWGLVVQSKHHSEAEGYYVLKTVRNTNPVGCQCTHYTLTQMQ